MDFANMSMLERLEFVKKNSDIPEDALNLIAEGKTLSPEQADEMLENAIGTYSLPYSIAPDFMINGRQVLVPMVGEEPYVVTSTNHGARLAAAGGGFFTSNTGSIMPAQVQLTEVSDPNNARIRILERKDEIMALADSVDPVLISFGGGCRNVEVRILPSKIGILLVVHLTVDVRDSMGAQVLNGMAEAVSPLLEDISGGRANVKVLSNRAFERLARARVCVPKDVLGGEKVVDSIVSAYAFADADPFRAATNNKGVMNGIIPVVIATGNDTRAVESGVHAYAGRSGEYKPITIWEKNANGDLEGILEVPMAVGIVGGTTKKHSGAQASLKLMGISSATELAEIIVSVGLAANLGVLYSLVTKGLYGDFEAARK